MENWLSQPNLWPLKMEVVECSIFTKRFRLQRISIFHVTCVNKLGNNNRNLILNKYNCIYCSSDNSFFVYCCFVWTVPLGDGKVELEIIHACSSPVNYLIVLQTTVYRKSTRVLCRRIIRHFLQNRKINAFWQCWTLCVTKTVSMCIRCVAILIVFFGKFKRQGKIMKNKHDLVQILHFSKIEFSYHQSNFVSIRTNSKAGFRSTFWGQHPLI